MYLYKIKYASQTTYWKLDKKDESTVESSSNIRTLRDCEQTFEE